MVFLFTSSSKFSAISSLCRVFAVLLFLSVVSMMFLLVSQNRDFDDVREYGSGIPNASSSDTTDLAIVNKVGNNLTLLLWDKAANSITFNGSGNLTVGPNFQNDTVHINESYLVTAGNFAHRNTSESRTTGENISNLTTYYKKTHVNSPVNDSNSSNRSENSEMGTNISKIRGRLKESYFVVFIIPTHPRKVDTRQLIRQTWANVSAWSLLREMDEETKKIKLMFILGRLPSNKYSSQYSAEFNKELSQNQDDMFVVDDITDGYQSLRQKVTWGMNYSHLHYNFKYLVKTDDDISVNLPVLLQALLKFRPGLRYTGSCINKSGRKPQRFTYCSGGGYVLSYELLGHVLNLPYTVYNRTLKPEDAFTGWLVWNVNQLNNVYNTTQYSVRAKWAVRALSLARYRCGKITRWFYHGYKKKPIEFRLQQFKDVFMNDTAIDCETFRNVHV